MGCGVKMPRKRNIENKGLPERWRYYHGAYYYQVPPGLEHLWEGKKQFRLGKTLPESYKNWAERLETYDRAKTINQLLDRYALEVTPKKSASSRRREMQNLEQLRPVFGNMPISAIKPLHIYKYADKRSRKIEQKHNGKIKVIGGSSAARHEIALLSHVYTKAVEWGYVARHPFKGEVRLEGPKARTRYVEDWEIVEALALPAMRKKGSVQAVQAYIRIKLLTGLRGVDLLNLKESQFKADGVHVIPSKTEHSSGKAVIYTWTDELRAAIAAAKTVRPVHISPYLFCNKRGECYWDEEKGHAPGWESMWKRFFIRVLEETRVTERFTEHDLRAKCASDAGSLEHARQLLAHTDAKTTNRIYRRKPEHVKPAR